MLSDAKLCGQFDEGHGAEPAWPAHFPKWSSCRSCEFFRFFFSFWYMGFSSCYWFWLVLVLLFLFAEKVWEIGKELEFWLVGLFVFGYLGTKAVNFTYSTVLLCLVTEKAWENWRSWDSESCFFKSCGSLSFCKSWIYDFALFHYVAPVIAKVSPSKRPNTNPLA